MIDIMRDYASIGMGTAQATTARLAGASRAGIGQMLAWSSSTLADVHEDPVGTATQRLAALATLVRPELDRAVGRAGHVSGEQMRALCLQVHSMERRLAGLRGDR